MPTITSITVYPVKSCKGIKCKSVLLTPSGFIYDRKWVIIDETGRFMSQRRIAKMALIGTSIPAAVLEGNAPSASDALQLDAPGMSSLSIPLLQNDESELVPTSVWHWSGLALDEGPAAAEWLATYLGRPARLVRHVGEVAELQARAAAAGSSAQRITSDDFVEGYPVNFQDAYACLLASESSMEDLNKSMGGTSHRVNRFRANIVVAGSPAWEEDSWRAVQVGGSGAVLLGVKPCTRCNVPDIEQETAEAGREVGRALVRLRSGEATGYAPWHKSFRSATFFGLNVVPAATGLVAAGDELLVTEASSEPPNRPVCTW